MEVTDVKPTEMFACELCGKLFPKHSTLVRHKSIIHSDKVYPCETCGKEFKYQHVLKLHIRQHTGEKPYACDVCGKTFADPSNCSQHRQSHRTTKVYSCKVCDKKFAYSGGVWQHMRLVHKPKAYECESCGRKSATSADHRKHLRVHLNEKHWKCSVCDKFFSDPALLADHKEVHNVPKPFPCEICGKDFRFEGMLRNHMERHESGENDSNAPSYRCEICGKDFRYEGMLRNHLERHEGAQATGEVFPNWNTLDDKLRQVDSQGKRCGGRVYTCKICGHMFSKMKALNTHLKEHGVKQFPCETCGKKFMTKHHLRLHNEFHIAEKKVNLSGQADEITSTTADQSGASNEVIVTNAKPAVNDPSSMNNSFRVVSTTSSIGVNNGIHVIITTPGSESDINNTFHVVDAASSAAIVQSSIGSQIYVVQTQPNINEASVTISDQSGKGEEVRVTATKSTVDDQSNMDTDFHMVDTNQSSASSEFHVIEASSAVKVETTSNTVERFGKGQELNIAPTKPYVGDGSSMDTSETASDPVTIIPDTTVMPSTGDQSERMNECRIITVESDADDQCSMDTDFQTAETICTSDDQSKMDKFRVATTSNVGNLPVIQKEFRVITTKSNAKDQSSTTRTSTSGGQSENNKIRIVSVVSGFCDQTTVATPSCTVDIIPNRSDQLCRENNELHDAPAKSNADECDIKEIPSADVLDNKYSSDGDQVRTTIMIQTDGVDGQNVDNDKPMAVEEVSTADSHSDEDKKSHIAFMKSQADEQTNTAEETVISSSLPNEDAQSHVITTNSNP